MPVISQSLARQTETLPMWDGTALPSWGETFDAGVGSVWDEVISMSMRLNREEWRERKDRVRRAVSSGEMTKDEYKQYFDRRGRFDYDRLAKARPDLELKTESQLVERRNKTLEIRRQYAEGVREKGPMSATFLGELTGYMTDPVNAASMAVATPVVAARAFPALNRVIGIGLAEGIVGAGSEALIQPLVYMHKQEIGSPYDIEDSIAAIGYAALGGFFFGGAVEGIGSMVKRIRGDVDNVMARGVELDDDEMLAYNALTQMERNLQDMPEFEFDARGARVVAEEEMLDDARAELARAVESGVDTVEIESRIARIEAGDIDAAEIDARVKELEVEARIEHEKEHLLRIEDIKEEMNLPRQPKPRVRVYPGESIPDSRIESLLDPEEAESLGKIRAEFDKIENPRLVADDGFVDARAEIQKDMDEIEGISMIEACIRE